MEINYVNRYGKYLEIKAHNVHIEENVESKTYHLNEDGRPDYIKPPIRDVDDYYLNYLSRALADMIDDRESDYDSSYVIECLFEKLPNNSRIELLNKLKYRYE